MLLVLLWQAPLSKTSSQFHLLWKVYFGIWPSIIWDGSCLSYKILYRCFLNYLVFCMFPSTWGQFRIFLVYFGLFFPTFWKLFFLMKLHIQYILDNTLMVLILKKYMVVLFFAESYFDFWTFWVFFYFFKNGSIFFHEIFNSSPCHYSRKKIWYVAFNLQCHFLVPWGPFWVDILWCLA